MNGPVSWSDATWAGTRKRFLPFESAEVRKAGGCWFCGVHGGSYSIQYRLPLPSVAPRKSTSAVSMLRVQSSRGFAGQASVVMDAMVPPSDGLPASGAPASGMGPASGDGPPSMASPASVAAPASVAGGVTLPDPASGTGSKFTGASLLPPQAIESIVNQSTDRMPTRLATVGSDCSFLRVSACWPLNVPTPAFNPRCTATSPAA